MVLLLGGASLMMPPATRDQLSRSPTLIIQKAPEVLMRWHAHAPRTLCAGATRPRLSWRVQARLSYDLVLEAERMHASRPPGTRPRRRRTGGAL